MEAEEEEKELVWSEASRLGLLAAACLVLTTCVLAGVVLVTHEVNVHNNVVGAEYNSRVLMWSSEYREEFAGLKVTITAAGEQTAMPADDTADDPGLEGVKYDALKYKSHSAADLSPQDWGSASIHQSKDEIIVKIYDHRTNLESKVDLGAVPFVSVEAKPKNHKMCRFDGYAAWVNGQCLKFRKLRRLCVQVSKATDGSWVLNEEQKGCEPQHGWSPWVLKSQKTGGKALTGAVDFSDLDIMVRSVHDPFLYMENAKSESSTLHFSRSAKFWLGCVLVAVGLILCIPYGVIAFFAVKVNYVDDENDAFSAGVPVASPLRGIQDLVKFPRLRRGSSSCGPSYAEMRDRGSTGEFVSGEPEMELGDVAGIKGRAWTAMQNAESRSREHMGTY